MRFRKCVIAFQFPGSPLYVPSTLGRDAIFSRHRVERGKDLVMNVGEYVTSVIPPTYYFSSRYIHVVLQPSVFIRKLEVYCVQF